MRRAEALLLGTGIVSCLLLTSGFWAKSVSLWAGTRWAGNVVELVLVPGAGILGLAFLVNIWPRDYGYRAFPSSWSTVDSALVLVIIPIGLCITHFMATRFVWAYTWHTIPTPQFETGTNAHIRVLVTTVLLAPFVEETFFRALPWLYLTSRFPGQPVVIPYVVITSLLFATAHWTHDLHGIVGAFAFGVVAAVIYTRVQNIWPLVLGHAVTNLWNKW